MAGLFLATVLLFSQPVPGGSASNRLSKPSEAFAYANAPMAEWEAAVKSGRPKTPAAPQDEVRRRLDALCPSFRMEDVSGEELYWLGKLCQHQPAIGLPVLEHYLAGTMLEHRPEAHMLLAVFQMRTSGSWVPAWKTLRTILQDDPIGPDEEGRIRTAIQDEADEDEATALRWSEERYSLLKERLQQSVGARSVSAGWVIVAGVDLSHRYYLAGRTSEAAAVLAEINEVKSKDPNGVDLWASEHLFWANMETKPAPAIPVLKAIGGSLGADIVQPGRVEVVSFFFLRCGPCLHEMAALSELQTRYPRDKVLVVDVSTYAVAMQPDAPPHEQIEAAIKKARKKESRLLTMALAPEQTLRDYGVYAFPVAAVIDKSGRLRYAGVTNQYDSGEEIDRLVHRLVNEQIQ